MLQGDTAVLTGFNSFDLNRRAVIDIEGNLINCAGEESGLVNINLSDASAAYEVTASANQFVTSSNGGLAVYLYDWPGCFVGSIINFEF